jgi:hypothetical protein
MTTPKETPTTIKICSITPTAEKESFSKMVEITKLEFRIIIGIKKREQQYDHIADDQYRKEVIEKTPLRSMAACRLWSAELLSSQSIREYAPNTKDITNRREARLFLAKINF